MTIQEILNEHTQSIRNGRCSCEDRGPKRTGLEHSAHVAEVLDKHMQEREAQAVRYANQGIVDSIDVPDTYLFVDHLTEYANRMESPNGS